MKARGHKPAGLFLFSANPFTMPRGSSTVVDEEQLSNFRERGFIVVENLLPPDRVAEVRRRAEEIVAGGGSRKPLERFGRQGKVVLRKVQSLCSTDPVFSSLARDPLLVDFIEGLFGEPALIFRDVLVVKPPHDGSKLHWHQDSAYWDIEPPALISAWIALTDVPASAGSLRFVPGSHRSMLRHSLYWTERRPLPHFVTSLLRKAVSFAGTGDNPEHAGGNRFLGRLKAGLLEGASRFVPLMARLADFRIQERVVESLGLPDIELPVSAGTVVFFHSLLVHSSNPNVSDNVRPAPIISYMPRSARFTGRGKANFDAARSPAVQG
jgi:ectoine hydroxylase-related dioxygenase (phytanoyl-CoA dioxygenase family)